MLIDTHAHLDFPEFAQDLPAVLERAAKADVRKIITIGISLASSREAVGLAGRYPGVYATVGIHPHDAFLLDEKATEILRELSRQEKVLAIGEAGLDYYRDYQPRAIQRKCLRRQLEVAADEKLPVVFHVRQAFDDFFRIVPEYLPSLVGAVMHCFSGDWTTAERCLDLGFHLSIPGTVTFPKAELLHDVVRRAPLDRLLVETDAPYLAPIPHRGKVNEPAFVYHTARKVAELRGCPFTVVADQTTLNAQRVFRMDGFSDAADSE
ncbi:TatD family hydrolase [Syntrophobacter fumaroxidans]|uniref:Hydrolase, TatD family n=1 Tax=Syntrophobacter fumaroxidans (strain DSM 10017 / MPOB) TaxID=335543 RepID=A0LPE4_SYNFM|nr:TatD family hydrolase [Syntrophobacter fumaroxidans]ABK19296.1 hydrolase, TatD family [Syntrophobacter fumaroxidans MPOB]